MSNYRIGHGYDAHRLAEGRRLVIGGVEIPYEKGLIGHSDADVLVHAIMDAIIGALGLGDIGKHFPDSSADYEGISSLVLLSKVDNMLKERGYVISNIDTTLVIQKPKITPYISNMVAAIAETLDIDAQRINLKATTEEGLGFTGREQGISAHAVVLISKK